MTDLQSFKWLKIKDTPNEIRRKSRQTTLPPKKIPNPNPNEKKYNKNNNQKNPTTKNYKFEEYKAKTAGRGKGIRE